MRGLWQSLTRAAEQYNPTVGLDPLEEGYLITFGLYEPIPQKCRAAVRKYIRQYATQCGWTLSNMELTKGYVRFLLKSSSKL